MKQALLNYLTEKEKTQPQFINLLTPDEKEVVALYKEQICHCLEVTLKKKNNVHFGISHKEETIKKESEVAIPYDELSGAQVNLLALPILWCR